MRGGEGREEKGIERVLRKEVHGSPLWRTVDDIKFIIFVNESMNERSSFDVNKMK